MTHSSEKYGDITTLGEQLKVLPESGSCADNQVKCSSFTSPEATFCVKKNPDVNGNQQQQCPITDIKLVSKANTNSFIESTKEGPQYIQVLVKPSVAETA